MELLYALTLGLLTTLRCVSAACGRVTFPVVVGLNSCSAYAVIFSPVLPWAGSTPANAAVIGPRCPSTLTPCLRPWY